MTARPGSTTSGSSRPPPDRTLLELSLHEGRNHIVRRLLDAVGHPVNRLVRVAVGPVRLGDQRPGTLRELTGEESSVPCTARSGCSLSFVG